MIQIWHHCYHSSGQMLMSYPPQFPQICCFCGNRRISCATHSLVEGHGDHLPLNDDARYLKDYDACPKRDAEGKQV